MQDGVAPFVKLDAGIEQFVVVRAAGVEHRPRIGFSGQHDLHVDAPLGGTCERLPQLRVGHEVGIGDVDVAFGVIDGRQQGQVNRAVVILGRAADGADDFVTAFVERGKVVLAKDKGVLLIDFSEGLGAIKVKS